MQSIFHCLFIFLVGPLVLKSCSDKLNHGVVLTEGSNGAGKPRNCSVAVLNSTSVLLTWKAPLNKRLVTSYWIHYRPLYSDENVQLHVGSNLQYVVKRLDVITYYAFRIVAEDVTGHHRYCEVFAKTKRDARLAVPLRSYHANNTTLIITWSAVNLQNVLVMYRLFMEWQSQSGIRVKLLYEGIQTHCVVQASNLPYPHRLSVSVVVGPVLNFLVQAANKPAYETKKALVPLGTGYEAATQRAVTVHSTYINTSINARGWNFVKLSWNSLKMELKGDVMFRLIYRTGREARQEVTTNNTALLSNLKQLKTYRITVQAEENNGTRLLASTEVTITTLDRNECTEIPGACSNGSECVNTRGSYLCRCPQGWTGDGKICKEWRADDASVGFCDSNVYANIIWERTLQGETMMVPCPFGTRGVAKRECVPTVANGPHPVWGIPDLSSCISDRMATITDQLDDLNVDLSEVAEQLVNATAVKSLAQPPLQTGDLIAVVDVIEKISQKNLGGLHDQIPSVGEQKIQQFVQAVVKSSSNILDTRTIGSWKYMPKSAMAIEASKLLKGLDAIALYLAKSGNFSEAAVSEASNVVLSVKSTFDAVPTAQQMPPSARSMRKAPSSSVLLPGSVLLLQTIKYNQSVIQYITFVSYRNLKVLMQPHMEESSLCSPIVNDTSLLGSTPRSFQPKPVSIVGSFTVPENETEVESIISEVVSVSISPMAVNYFEDPVTLAFKTSQDNPNWEAHCVYWNMSSDNGFWSEDGCELMTRNSSHTVCQCYHLTSFAVLMRIRDMPKSKEIEKHQFALTIISYVGISISVVALFISFLTFTCLRFRNTRLRYFVHANLALTLAVAQIGFLFGINKTENQIICKIIAAALHYLFLVSFCWMALEGVVLYLMLVKIFRTKSKPGRDRMLFFLCGWGIPVIIVGVCAGFFHRGYGTESFCWLALENHFSWAFVAPVLLICLFNCICLGKTFMVMSKRRRKAQRDSPIEKIRYWSRSCALLSCLLGLTWILGVFVVNTDTIFMAYLFNVFNTLQGLLIFLFHCIGDEKVRSEYLRFVCCQTRAIPYGTGRTWWNKSDSFSRSRTSEDKSGKTRRNTLPSTADYAKTTSERMATQRSNSTAERGGSILQGSIARPLELCVLYGTTDNGHLKEKQTDEDNVQRAQETEKSIEAENRPTILEATCQQESMATAQNNQLAEQDSPECTLPDVVQKDSQDCESMV